MNWNFVLFALLVFIMAGMNEVGFGVFALLLLFPAVWLLRKIADGRS